MPPYTVVHPDLGEHVLATHQEVAAQLREWKENDELDIGIYVVEASVDPDTEDTGVGPNVPLSSFLPELAETYPDA